MRNEKKQARRGPLLFLVIIAAVALLAYAEISYGLISASFDKSRKRLAPEGIVFAYPSDARPIFSRGENGFLCVTKDSATYFSYKGDLLWNDTFSMQSPYVAGNGDNWAILEPEGRSVSVYGESGKLYDVLTEYPVLSAYINKISCLMLILEAGDRYKIQIYNNEGITSYEMVSGMEGIYPVCAALTDDGMYFCVGYIDTSGASLSSRLLYFYTDSGARKYGTDDQTPFKAIEKPGAVISKLLYNSGGLLSAITDGEIFVTSVKGEEVFTYTLKNQLNSDSFSDEAIGIAAGRPLTNAAEPLEAGSALLFDYEGKELASFAGGIESIGVYEGLTLIKNASDYVLSDLSGRELWAHGASDDILAVIPIDKNRAVIARAGAAEIYRATRKPPDQRSDDN